MIYHTDHASRDRKKHRAGLDILELRIFHCKRKEI